MMSKELHTFLNSDILHKYLIGEASALENAKVEYYMLKYPEVKTAYNTLQNNLEIKAKFEASEAPKDILQAVMQQIELEKNSTKTIALNTSKSKSWYNIAASIAACIFAITALWLFQNNQQLKTENNTIAEEIFDLRNDIETNNKKLNNISNQITKLKDPYSQKYLLNGNELAKDLQTVAYINPIAKTTLIDVVSLPEISEDQYYQIRAELNNSMVSLGILHDNENQLKPLPYLEDAVALSITLESKNDSLSQKPLEVAVVALQ